MLEDTGSAPAAESAPAEAAPSAAPATTAAPLLGAQSDAGWLASLPEEIRAAPSLAKFKDPAALAQSYVALESKLGQRGVAVPGENAKPEDVAAFRKALGVPEKPEGYEIKLPEGMSGDVWPEAMTGTLQGWAHDLGLTPQQAAGLAERMAKATAEGRGVERSEAEAALRKDWGDKFEAQLGYANRAIAQFGGPELVAALTEAGLGNDPRLARAFAKIGAAMAEDAPAGMGGAPVGIRTPEAIRAEINEIMGERSSPYWDKRHASHRDTVARVTRLHQELARFG